MDEVNFTKIVIEAVVKNLIEKAINAFKKSEKPPSLLSRDVENDFENKIINHFNEVYTWSNEIEFIGLAHPIYTNVDRQQKGD